MSQKRNKLTPGRRKHKDHEWEAVEQANHKPYLSKETKIQLETIATLTYIKAS